MKNPEHLTVHETQSEKTSYPFSKEEKEKYLPSDYSFREVKAEMMDIIYNYLNADLSLEKLAIEVPPGARKSLGYLLPAALIATPKKPIVISTYTTGLQNK